MKKVNEARITLESRSCNEAFARTAVSAFAMLLDPTLDELADIKTAVSEAVTNCIVHAYKSRIGRVYITARICGRIFSVTVRDRGCGIEDVKKAMEPEYTSCPEGERAGVGFSVMRAFMDTLRVRSKPGRGTSVTMTKVLGGRESGEP